MVCFKCMNKFFLLTILSLFIFAQTTQAKVLPQAGKAGAKQSSIKSTGTTIGISPKLRSDRRALIVNFSNLQNATSVSYNLVYKTATQQEGAGGALNLKGQSTDKVELLFGTCSANICKYHTGIKDAKLEVSYTTKSGKKYIKKFKIKV